jgi:DNA (cytosine-5)-methyltransferase 1
MICGNHGQSAVRHFLLVCSFALLNLFFDIARIIEIKKPSVIFLENVKNFKNHDGGNTFNTVKKILIDLGYDFHSKIINSNRVVPQNRERFYMVCFKGGNKAFEFPKFEGDPIPLKRVLEKNVPKKYTISDKLWEGHQRRTKNNLERGTGFTAFTVDTNKPANTIVARYGKDGKECLIPQKNENPRKLTPRECARLQGFPENYILPESDAPAYKQFGNSVAVPVITKIGEQILKALKNKK